MQCFMNMAVFMTLPPKKRLFLSLTAVFWHHRHLEYPQPERYKNLDKFKSLKPPFCFCSAKAQRLFIYVLTYLFTNLLQISYTLF